VKVVVITVAAFLLLAIPAALFFLSATPVVDLKPAPALLGAETPVNVEIWAPYGVRRVAVTVEQNSVKTSAETKQSPNRFTFWQSRPEQPFTVTQKLATTPKDGFRNGPAKLIVEAESNDLRGAVTRREYEVKIDLRPPTLKVDGEQHYINQGGAELVTFEVGGYWTEAGVRIGQYSFRSFPLPGASNANQRFSLFAWPWDVPANMTPVVYARNEAGGETIARFWFKLFPKQFRKRELPLDDGFLEKVTAEIDPGGPGSLLERYLKINGEMRRKNNAALAELRGKTAERFLWSTAFEQLSNSKVEAFFADVRSYMYGGKKVDEQVHLGFDLSVTANVPVVSSNDGVVVYADRLGIYGNCVVVDHGYGLQSIYAHLSEIGVKPGQAVKKREVLGKSGATGLAGGDHLHYSMQIDGVQVNPVEWWDAHWIQDRIFSKVKPHGVAQ